MKIPNQNLSANFTLYEFLSSHSISEQFEPPQLIVDNLKLLCDNILQPLRARINTPLKITSGYRCLRLNTMIKGSRNSQHLLGQAADIEDFKNGNLELFNEIKTSGFPFDQLINEFNFSWVHVSFRPNPRGEILQAVKDGSGRTVYVKM
jgi:zinc D-Ala-D-Ala carboxypeptidase